MNFEQLSTIKAYNADCKQIMKQYPDGYFDLAIVDPPYGLNEGGKDKNRRRRGETKKAAYKESSEWDSHIPEAIYFKELFRISKNQIIWGANYMVNHISPSMGWIVWDKGIAGDFSDCELAYSSFNRALKKVYIHYMSDYNGNWHLKIHPTQKPIKLYEWLLINYAKPGDKILDTHGGSMSHAIACHNLGYDLTIIEKDKDYFDAAIKRIKWHQKQQVLQFEQ